MPVMNRTCHRLLAVMVAVLLSAGTASAQMGMGGPASAPPPPASSDDVLPSVDEEIANDAQAVWARAEKEFEDEDWLEAIAYYQHLRTKFSYNVQLAALAELRLGDVGFERERWSEARGHYRAFLRFHPKHEKADYAAYRVGLCSYREIPGDSWITPPSIERDQSDVRETLRMMREFQAQFPKSQWVPEAQKASVRCQDMLAAHELYVAEFYAKREKWKGTVLRTRTLVNTYPESTLAPEALALQVEAHAKLGDGERAKESMKQLQARKPSDGLLSRGRKALESLQ